MIANIFGGFCLHLQDAYDFYTEGGGSMHFQSVRLYDVTNHETTVQIFITAKILNQHTLMPYLVCNKLIQVCLAEKSNVVVYAVVGSVLVSTLGIISLVTGAVIVKRKKELDKMRKQQVWHL
jgi:hypothetical protein